MVKAAATKAPAKDEKPAQPATAAAAAPKAVPPPNAPSGDPKPAAAVQGPQGVDPKSLPGYAALPKPIGPAAPPPVTYPHPHPTIPGRVVHRTLADAKLAVMAEVPYVQKNQPKQGGGIKYSYASEAALIESLHPACVKHGLTFTPTRIRVIDKEPIATVQGRPMNRLVVSIQYKITHADSGESDVCVAMGESMDVGDKTAPKASTIAYKYMLRQAFMIETGDDPDKEPSEPMERVDLAHGPMGESYKRAIGAIDQTKTIEQLNGIRGQFRYKEGRNWNYNAHQLADLEDRANQHEKKLAPTAQAQP